MACVHASHRLETYKEHEVSHGTGPHQICAVGNDSVPVRFFRVRHQFVDMLAGRGVEGSQRSEREITCDGEEGLRQPRENEKKGQVDSVRP